MNRETEQSEKGVSYEWLMRGKAKDYRIVTEGVRGEGMGEVMRWVLEGG